MDVANYIDGAVGISPLEGEMAGRPEGVASAASTSFAIRGVGASRAATPSVAFGDISPSRGEITKRHPMRLARHQAIVAAGHAGAADIRADLVNAAGRVLANLAGQRRTAHALAAHAGQVSRHEFFRDPVELRIVFHREAWPFGGVGTAGAAALTVEDYDRALIARQKVWCVSQVGGRDGGMTGSLRQGAISSCLPCPSARPPAT